MNAGDYPRSSLNEAPDVGIETAELLLNSDEGARVALVLSILSRLRTIPAF